MPSLLLKVSLDQKLRQTKIRQVEGNIRHPSYLWRPVKWKLTWYLGCLYVCNKRKFTMVPLVTVKSETFSSEQVCPSSVWGHKIHFHPSRLLSHSVTYSHCRLLWSWGTKTGGDFRIRAVIWSTYWSVQISKDQMVAGQVLQCWSSEDFRGGSLLRRTDRKTTFSSQMLVPSPTHQF